MLKQSVFDKEIGVLKSPSFTICTKTSCFTNLNSGPVVINMQEAASLADPNATENEKWLKLRPESGLDRLVCATCVDVLVNSIVFVN